MPNITGVSDGAIINVSDTIISSSPSSLNVDNSTQLPITLKTNTCFGAVIGHPPIITDGFSECRVDKKGLCRAPAPLPSLNIPHTHLPQHDRSGSSGDLHSYRRLVQVPISTNPYQHQDGSFSQRIVYHCSTLPRNRAKVSSTSS